MALDLRKLHGPGVDRALGVLEPTVDLWESGAMTPTKSDLKRLAMLTGFPEEFFYRPVHRLLPKDLVLTHFPPPPPAPCCQCGCHPGQGALL